MNIDPFERCNLWLMYSALACGIDKLRFVALWDGGGGDGPGGTAHMYNEVKRRTGRGHLARHTYLVIFRDSYSVLARPDRSRGVPC